MSTISAARVRVIECVHCHHNSMQAARTLNTAPPHAEWKNGSYDRTPKRRLDKSETPSYLQGPGVTALKVMT
jgi:hypothetical protein